MNTTFLKSIWKDEGGATAIEYGLIAALVSVAAIGALTAMGGSLNTMFTSISDTLDGAVTTGSGGTETPPADPAPSGG